MMSAFDKLKWQRNVYFYFQKEETVQKKDKKEAINQTNLVQELARLKQSCV